MGVILDLSLPARIALAAIGAVVVMFGLGAWALETEYGGNAVVGMEFSNGVTRVFDVDEQSFDAKGHQMTTIVFEGTHEEATAYADARWSEGRNYLIPGVVIGIGALLVIGSLVPSRKKAVGQTQ